MFVQIRLSRIEQRQIIAEQAECAIAVGAKQLADDTRLVVMVNGQISRLSRCLVWRAFWFAADGTHAVLFAQHLLVAGGVNAKGRPLALLYVMCVA